MNLFNINIPKSVIYLTVLAVVMNILRIIIWDKDSFIYILWNIFLAFVPFIISSFILFYYRKKRFNNFLLIFGMFIWLIFIPNAPYIVTDFIHLGEIRSIPILFDILLIFSSAIVGLILGAHSLFHIEQIFNMKFSQRKTSIIIMTIILLISFGLYLGRFLRFNSWDIFINHTSLIKNVWNIFSDPSSSTDVFLYALMFFFFNVFFYYSWKSSKTK